MVSRLLLLFHTVRYLRPIQIYSRIKFKLYSPSIDLNKAPSLHSREGQWNVPIQLTKSLLNQWTFSFLNEEHSLNSSNDWDNNKFSKLWRYNLHYFDDLNARDAITRIDWHRELLIKWIQENPPTLGSGWEPYPTSLRIVNWIKWNLAGNELPDECIHSLSAQIRWLSKRLEFHILGNHLFANAKALIYAGLFFNGPEADKWLSTGLDILNHEVKEQILKDGGHFERSPMYHAIILEDLLDLLNVSTAFPDLVPEQRLLEWKSVVEKMFSWLRKMLHPDGGFSFFNDTAFGIAASFTALNEYAERLNIKSEIKNVSLTHLSDSGYVRIESDSVVGLIDVAPIGPDYLPGHAHADTLSFELSLFGNRVFVNSGISQYGNDSLRQKQRSTALHNTVSINGMDSSEIWAGFRVARRAYPDKLNIENNTNEIIVSCSHNGYKRLRGKCIHKREWLFKEHSLCITDKITGVYKCATANFYIHPDIKVDAVKGVHDIFNLHMPSGNLLKMTVKNADKSSLISSKWYPEFGMSIDNQCITVDFSVSEITVLIEW